MRRRLSQVIAGSALLLAAPAAWGATAAFSVGATCEANCAAVGIDFGDPVLGRIEISTDAFAPNGAVSRADLTGFGINFGSSSAGVFKAGAEGYAFSATWGADTSTLNDVSFTAAATSMAFFSAVAGVNLISLQGSCGDLDCTAPSIRGASATLGPVTFKPASVAPVPLPAAASLAAAGALALAALARLRGVRSGWPDPGPWRRGKPLALRSGR